MKKFQFSLKDECMKELPSMEEPKRKDYNFSYGHNEAALFTEHRIHYANHLASLQSIPVFKEFVNQFIDQEIYDEAEINWHMKYPKQKVDDTELWEGVLSKINDYIGDYLTENEYDLSGLISILQKHYTITRKQN